MTSALDLVVRLLLALLLVVAPSLAVIAADSPWSSGITDGSDGGSGDDGSRRGQLPLLAPTAPPVRARPVGASVRLPLPLDREASPDPTPDLRSSRSPPPR